MADNVSDDRLCVHLEICFKKTDKHRYIVPVSVFRVRTASQMCISSQSSVRSFHFQVQVLWFYLSFLSSGGLARFVLGATALSLLVWPLGGLVTMATPCTEVAYSEACGLRVEPLREYYLYSYLCLCKQCFSSI